MTEEEKTEIIEKNKKIAFNNRICADKKPYFFGYIYPKIMTQYNVHRNNYKQLCKIMFHCNIFDLIKKENRTSEENKIVYQFSHYSPLLKNKCIMNVLAEYVEDIEFDNKWKREKRYFDYSQLMSGNYALDDKEFYKQVKAIIAEFNTKYTNVLKERKSVENLGLDLSDDDTNCFGIELSCLIKEYENKLISICSDCRKTCDYVIDIYYKHFNTKSKIFIWETFGDIVLENVKSKAISIRYPVLDDNGIDYLGKKYSMKEVKLT